MKVVQALCFSSLLFISPVLADDYSVFNIYGNFESDGISTGDIVVFPGDLNNDGVPDIVTAAPQGEKFQGQTLNHGYVKAISGADRTTLFIVYGDYGYDTLGFNGLFLPGDLNADGTPDILAASYSGDPYRVDPNTATGFNSGIIKAISGKTGQVLYNVYGNVSQDELTDSGVFLPGDLNKDGTPDFIAGSIDAYKAGTSTYDLGMVKAVSGRDGSTIFDVYGKFNKEALSQHGIFLPGDLSGDDVPDILAVSGDASSTPANNKLGVLRAISGTNGAILYEVYGDYAQDQLGSSGTYLPGDLNTDGVPDIIVASESADSASGANDNVGIVKVISGANGSILFNVRGDLNNDKLANQKRVFLPGDLNKDGIPDIIAASPFANSLSGQNDVGIIKAISGANGSLIFNVRGDFPVDALSISEVYFPGDLNTDGTPDIIAASALADSASGVNDDVGIIKAISGLNGNVLYSLRGDFSFDQLARDGIFLPGDLNLDNIPDLILASHQADSASGANDQVGLLKVVSGANGSLMFNLRGDFKNDALTYRGDYYYQGVSLPGDINRDGIPDIIVMAPVADSGQEKNDDIGMVRTYSGASGEVLYSVYGSYSFDYLGLNDIHYPGDMNKDGVPEYIIASRYSNSEPNAAANNDVGVLKFIYSDACPNNGVKTEPGICGCGKSDLDSDLDGVICEDQCPLDSAKSNPGLCGCGQPETCQATVTPTIIPTVTPTGTPMPESPPPVSVTPVVPPEISLPTAGDIQQGTKYLKDLLKGGEISITALGALKNLEKSFQLAGKEPSYTAAVKKAYNKTAKDLNKLMKAVEDMSKTTNAAKKTKLAAKVKVLSAKMKVSLKIIKKMLLKSKV